MCGIVAYLDLNGGTAPVDLTAALDLLHHRGPDGQGVWHDASVGLGHVRLSIMDVAHGQQPLHAGGVHAVVNGEFYEFEAIRDDLCARGHVFSTQSDSEILVHLYNEYGVNCVDHLLGEFAFVLWDANLQRLLVGRDRHGIKPLFYTQFDNKLVIASETKAFLGLGWQPQWDVHSIVNSGHYADDRTIFKGVSKIPPGQILSATPSGSIKLERYFSPSFPDRNIEDPRSIDEMVDGVRTRLVDAVRARLRSDVPVAVYLSGGIDSSAVLGVASSILRETDPDARMDVFTIAFSDKEIDGVKYDESDVAARTAEFVQANSHVLHITQEDLTGAFEDAVWHWEAAMNDFNGAAKFLLSRYVRDAGYKVVLTGEGSDEHFAGYTMFYPDLFRMDTAPPAIPRPMREKILATIESADEKMWSGVGSLQFSYTDCGKERALLSGLSIHRMLATIAGLPADLYKAPLNAISNPTQAFAAVLSAEERKLAATTWHPLHTALCLETRCVLPNMLCNQLGDRSEMAHSIEGRVPFLDHRLTTYVNALPPQVKLHVDPMTGKITEKWILRQAMRPFITDELYTIAKKPFFAPPAQFDPDCVQWQFLSHHITREAVENLGWMNWAFVEQTIADYKGDNVRRAQNILNVVASFIVLSQKFDIPTYVPPSQ
ncbi:asparagine synthase (glutamine-hydrolyzing) [Saprolegnia diclina VS20]|uniref:Asparagine synthase (Glutamine-hydrolyzing) n=1 Tax=Saprolegnia diclina (strain VS20) TaxID=1156394 RepID=T0R5P2_SAPDV|nr:asparagine synthase (glutamine-hydrolyzing) [Saprolegnia diclina VS20]EQC41730.1 asparagine synthase (glutamine-hydrolyzing) [Saprolegnia diclina VS20]|eukprot:XP_008605444.1 asparagine synthase (glutamine-hydrolyzing) [Saprolegnia diclina VS20]